MGKRQKVRVIFYIPIEESVPAVDETIASEISTQTLHSLDAA